MNQKRQEIAERKQRCLNRNYNHPHGQSYPGGPQIGASFNQGNQGGPRGNAPYSQHQGGPRGNAPYNQSHQSGPRGNAPYTQHLGSPRGNAPYNQSNQGGPRGNAPLNQSHQSGPRSNASQQNQSNQSDNRFSGHQENFSHGARSVGQRFPEPNQRFQTPGGSNQNVRGPRPLLDLPARRPLLGNQPKGRGQQNMTKNDERRSYTGGSMDMDVDSQEDIENYEGNQPGEGGFNNQGAWQNQNNQDFNHSGNQQRFKNAQTNEYKNYGNNRTRPQLNQPQLRGGVNRGPRFETPGGFNESQMSGFGDDNERSIRNNAKPGNQKSGPVSLMDIKIEPPKHGAGDGKFQKEHIKEPKDQLRSNSQDRKFEKDAGDNRGSLQNQNERM